MEFQSLQDYVALLDRHVPAIVDHESALKAGLADLGVDEQAIDELHELQIGAATRLIAGSTIVALWAAYEAAVLECARHLQQKREIALCLSQLRGPFLGRARLYFDDVLTFDLHPPTAVDWDRLKLLAELRHSFAHDNGMDLGPKTRRGRRLRTLASRHPELRIVDGYIVPSIKFVEEAAQYLGTLVRDLVARIRTTYP
jgi:hypothetical protein